MANMLIRNIPDDVYNALKETLLPENRPNLAEVFAEFRRRTGGINLGDIRSKEIAEPIISVSNSSPTT